MRRHTSRGSYHQELRPGAPQSTSRY
ncbi:hypothetical protein GIW30_22180 [Pseudomonas sp. PA-5-4G]|nr:hypothetical protein [Pseudomonas sp. PA-5-4H]MCF5238225.1 hypothetical protein [Pseudomonas sp. PA-5-4G]MCF5251090.1 hypothetical protein [Pseudomonas sp. PA-5-4B]MCF5257194.1 hypothetical protein [Pseudomonas sp. PA-5-4B]MCF5263365.1 hypothetical protein [Pseudomonas sp. PA-5-4A]